VFVIIFWYEKKQKQKEEMWGWGVEQNHEYLSIRWFKNAIELYTFTWYLSSYKFIIHCSGSLSVNMVMDTGNC